MQQQKMELMKKILIKKKNKTIIYMRKTGKREILNAFNKLKQKIQIKNKKIKQKKKIYIQIVIPKEDVNLGAA
jgi:hypothetical protein